MSMAAKTDLCPLSSDAASVTWRQIRRLCSIGVFLLAFPTSLAGQAPGFGVEARAGVGLPVGELAEFLDPGPAFGVKVLFGLTERVSVTADGAVMLLEGIPNVQAWSYLAGLRVGLLGSSRSRWSVVADGAFGGTSFVKGEFVTLPLPPPAPPPPRGTFLGTSATLRTGVGVERLVGSRFVLFLDAAWQRMFTEAEDVTVEGLGTSEGFGATSAVPIAVGLRFHP